MSGGFIDPVEFAERLNQAIQRAGLMPIEVSRRSGVPKSTLSRYCNAQSLPSAEHIFPLADAVGLDARFLLIGAAGERQAATERQRSRVREQIAAEERVMDDLRQALKERLAGLRLSSEEKAENAALHASIIRGQAEILLQLIDQRIQRQRVIHDVSGLRGIAKLLRYCKRLFGTSWQRAVHRPVHGDLQVAQDGELDLQLAEAVFKHPQAVHQARLAADRAARLQVEAQGHGRDHD